MRIQKVVIDDDGVYREIDFQETPISYRIGRVGDLLVEMAKDQLSLYEDETEHNNQP